MILFMMYHVKHEERSEMQIQIYIKMRIISTEDCNRIPEIRCESDRYRLKCVFL